MRQVKRKTCWLGLAILLLTGCKGDSGTDGNDANVYLGDIGPSQVTLPDAELTDAGLIKELPRGIVTGQVKLPDGFTGDITKLKVLTSVGEADLDGEGNFTVDGTAGGRQGAMVIDENDNALLLGWVKVGQQSEINTTTTAAVYLFNYGGAASLPFSAWDRAAELLLQHSSTKELASVFDNLLSSNNMYLESPTTEFTTAIENALYSIVPWVKKQTSALVLVNPAVTKSGVTVLIGDRDGNSNSDINQITLMNEYRRRAACFIERKVGETNYVQEKSFELPPTAGLNGVMGSIIDVMNGNGAYTPQYYGPIGLGQVTNDDDKIVYRVIVAGGGGTQNNQIQLTTAQNTERNIIMVKGLLIDAILPMLFSFVDMDWVGKVFESPAFGTFVVELVKKTYDGTTQNFLDALGKGDLDGASLIFSTYLQTDDSFNQWYFSQLQQIALSVLGEGNTEQLISKWSNLILKPLEITNKLLTIADFAVIVNDWIKSENISDWEVTVTPPKVLFTPAKATLSCGEKSTFRVTVKNAGQTLTENLTYIFSIDSNGNLGTLTTDANPSYLNSFETTDPTVYYTVKTDGVTSGSTDEIRVSVNMFTEDVTGNKITKQYVGSGTAKVILEPTCVSSYGYGGTEAYTSGCTHVLTVPSVVYPGDEVTVTAQATIGGVCGSASVWMSYAVEAEIDGEPASGGSGSGIYDFCYWGTPQPVVPGGVSVNLPDEGTHTITFTISPDIKCPVCIKFEPNGGPCVSNSGNRKNINGPAVVMEGTGGTHGWSTVRFFEIQVDEEQP